MGSESQNGGLISVLRQFKPKRTRIRVAACVAASRSLTESSDDETGKEQEEEIE
ncbi:hypothetical protein [Haloferax mucosum]|uniref:hypothetical protein n=1 Tax=Haloferax mucosum TaxID=403181 RepID=UPI00032623BA|nr:hypothetical protein [Haloferax mucosum]